ncbi:hypothetical protein NQ315_009953 [Exocentrus adspersus]|uniref:Engrailed n=1 Tax=Exocentrus adspersus TaxID=1586481 RepID=A0AAV8WJY2_9CUCU|nr:hypothetical protein NQ315_009953 [Exocentrus adspersus]
MAALAGNMVPQPHHFSRQNVDSAEGSVSMDSSDNFDRESPNIDNASCCSDDTVLSVGNENPVQDEGGGDETLSFKNIESHLNAISQITNSTLNPELGLRGPSSPLNHRLSPAYCFRTATDFDKSNSTDLFRQNQCSPRSVASSPESSSHSPRCPDNNFCFNQKDISNNDANGASLKFSIDNILKADFGRRITDPINIRKSKPARRAMAECAEDGGKLSGPVDLSKGEEKATTATTTTTTTEKKEEQQPMLWPAWVYCTRYSDRPSSGKQPHFEYLPIFLVIFQKNCPNFAFNIKDRA